MNFDGPPSSVSRYELKYLVPLVEVAALQRDVLRYCEPDAWSRSRPYVVSSLYLDSPALTLYRQTREGHPQRIKLRARRYTSGPLFLEVKSRQAPQVRKIRAEVDTEDWPQAFLRSGTPGEQRSPSAAPAPLETFQRVGRSLAAAPSAIVRYRRRAFNGRDDYYARVTFDDRLEVAAPSGWTVPVDESADWIRFDPSCVVGRGDPCILLELKSTEAVPHWMIDLVQRFDLRPISFSKYAVGVESLRERNTTTSPWL